MIPLPRITHEWRDVHSSVQPQNEGTEQSLFKKVSRGEKHMSTKTKVVPSSTCCLCKKKVNPSPEYGYSPYPLNELMGEV